MQTRFAAQQVIVGGIASSVENLLNYALCVDERAIVSVRRTKGLLRAIGDVRDDNSALRLRLRAAESTIELANM